MIVQLIRLLQKGPTKAPKTPGWSTLTQHASHTRLGRLYVRILMVSLLSVSIFLLVTANSQREVVEAIVMALIVTVCTLALNNAVPTYWVLVGKEGIQFQNKTVGFMDVPWDTVKETRTQKTIMKGPLGPFYEDAPKATLNSSETFLNYMKAADWSIVLITEKRWITINARDFDDPIEAGRVLGSRLLTQQLIDCDKSEL